MAILLDVIVGDVIAERIDPLLSMARAGPFIGMSIEIKFSTFSGR